MDEARFAALARVHYTELCFNPFYSRFSMLVCFSIKSENGLMLLSVQKGDQMLEGAVMDYSFRYACQLGIVYSLNEFLR